MLERYIKILFILLMSSCAPGFIYTDIVQPKCVDMRSTPLGESTVKGGTYRFEIPVTKLDMSAEWNSRAVGDVAKRHGMSTVYYCDMRTVSILGGIYRKKEIIVYGK